MATDELCAGTTQKRTTLEQLNAWRIRRRLRFACWKRNPAMVARWLHNGTTNTSVKLRWPEASQWQPWWTALRGHWSGFKLFQIASTGFSKLCFLRQGEAMKAIQPGEVVQSDSTSKVQAQEWISAESWKLMKLENAEDTSAYASWQWAIPDICICDLKSSRQQLLPLSLSVAEAVHTFVCWALQAQVRLKACWSIMTNIMNCCTTECCRHMLFDMIYILKVEISHGQVRLP